MSISGLYLGTRALQAHQLALEVTGQNISNVNTEGYSRQRASYVQSMPINTAIGQKGTGVEIDGIERIRDAFIDLEIRKQSSDVGSMGIQADMYSRVEMILNDPSGESIDAMLGDFFDAIYDVVNSPEESGLRNTTLVEAEALARQLQFVNGELDQLRLDVDTAVTQGVTEINGLLHKIAGLNKDIVKIEAGSLANANDLRDKRDLALKELSEWTSINATEMQTGEVNISIGGQNVVFGGEVRTFGLELQPGEDLPIHRAIMSDTGTVINFTGGKMEGYIESRDTNITKYTDRLDELARGLIDEFNQLHTQGAGTQGFSTVASNNAVSDSSVALENSQLAISPVDSTFTITVRDQSVSPCTETAVNISVDVSADSLDDVAAHINTALTTAGITDISATVNADNELEITSSDADSTFFVQDTTNNANNFLSAIGLNTFFTGTDASNIAVNSLLKSNPQFFAASSTRVAGDNANALAMADLRNVKNMDSGTKTLTEFYQTLLVDLGADTRGMQTNLEAANSFLTSLNLKRESISGVNLDEEAANLILFQRAYEASARYISVVDSLLNTLINGLV